MFHARSLTLFNTRNVAPLAVSLAIHVVALAALALVRYSVANSQMQLVLDSIFSEERVQEQFEREVDASTEVAETINFVPSSALSSAVAVTGSGGGGVIGAEKIDNATTLQEPDFQFRPAPIALPGLGIIGKDLGSGNVSGEPGRVVEGYGAALSQITQELMRLMRQEKILVCWLFDASESMEDDRREIRDNFHKVYEELGLVTRSDEKLRLTEEPILTSVFTFNKTVVELTAKPTSDVSLIRQSIDKIVKDESGEERFCEAVSAVIQKYGKFAAGQKRKLVIVIMSDESGDDGHLVEESIDRCKRANASVYFLGRYAVFGFPYAIMAWKDPKYGLTHWLRINRGPETAQPECLQFDGLHHRWDAYSSGFGPYAQVRLCRETGGIYFLLPGEEDNLTGRGSHEQRKFDLLDMKEYLPDLSPMATYVKERDSSKFRNGLWNVINKLNPYIDKELEMREDWFPHDPQAFAREGAINFQRAVRALRLLNEAIVYLDGLAPLRDSERSQRWRAHYDLIHAQLYAYRVRLFQYILALDQHQKNKPQPKDPKSNVWHAKRNPKMLPPDDLQVKQAGVDLKELEEQEKKARQEFQAIIANHPNTPWARLAQAELRTGFGVTMVEGYRDPRYDLVGKDIKLPNP
jgi:hypothetical protein